MNCKHVLLYLQECSGADLSSGIENAEISSHLNVCAECARMVNQQRELAESLRVVRDSECNVPAALDAKVLANYHRQISELKKQSVVSVWISRPVTVLAWSAVAAALVFAAILFSSLRREVTTTSPPTGLPTESTIQIADKPAPTTKALTKDVAVRKRNRGRRGRGSARSEPHLPQEAFRSLMYCDELSCSDAMEMIRVEMPAALVTRPMPASMSASGVVTADVLVGPDGIARGIRIEE